MNPQPMHACHGCLSRRHCLQLLSSAAVGLTFSGSVVSALAKSRPPAPDFVDPAKLRPRPLTRLEAAYLQQPRPYWLGWPGTAYPLDKAQAEYSARLKQSCAQLGLTLRAQARPVEKEAELLRLHDGIRQPK